MSGSTQSVSFGTQKNNGGAICTAVFALSAAAGGIGFAAVGCRICVIGAKTADHYSGDDDNPPEVIVIAATVVKKHFDHLITGYVKFRKVLRHFFCNKNTAKNI